MMAPSGVKTPQNSSILSLLLHLHKQSGSHSVKRYKLALLLVITSGLFLVGTQELKLSSCSYSLGHYVRNI